LNIKRMRVCMICISMICISMICMSATLLAAAEPGQIVRVSQTQHFDFPSGGTIRLKNSTGVLTIEAWDRPEVEITTIKSTKVEIASTGREGAAQKLGKVHVACQLRGNELMVTTAFPGPRDFPLRFDLEYHIKAPANTRIVDNHHFGDVNIDGLVNDIDVSVGQGEIMLHLPQEGLYSIQAKSNFGSVNSDFSELEKHSWWLLGHRSVNANTGAALHLNLKVEFGDIVLLRTRLPKAPDSLLSARRAEGL